MSNAQQLFVIYGTVIIGVGFILGSILGMARMKQPYIRSLATAHVETLMQGAMHLGLAFAVGLVDFDSGWATLGAWLLVIGSAMQAFGVTMNWIQGTKDQFAEKSIGFLVNSASTFVAMPGLIITAFGILRRV